MTFKFIDLFAGIGGFHHALRSLGGRCVLACEHDATCNTVYEASFPQKQEGYEFVENIRSITRNNPDDPNDLKTELEISDAIPEHDVLCAGFPCQPFSKSGAQEGTRDQTRGTLFHDIFQIVEAKKPPYLFLENVRNLAGPRHQDTWETIVGLIQGAGYAMHDEPLIFSPHLLSKKRGGAPQVRDRVYILAIHESVSGHTERLKKIIKFNEQLRSKKFKNPDTWSIRGHLYPDEKIPNLTDYLLNAEDEKYLEAWNDLVENLEQDDLPGFPIWAFAFLQEPDLDGDLPDWKKDFLKKNRRFYIDNKAFIDSWLQTHQVLEFPHSRQKFEWQARKHHPKRINPHGNRTVKDLVCQLRPSGIRVKPPSYLPALVAITQTSVIGPEARESSPESKRYRKLTPVEAGVLQGIPKRVFKRSARTKHAVVSDKDAYKQLGNAINVKLVREVARYLLGQK